LYILREVRHMQVNQKLLQDIPLFRGIKEPEFGTLFGCVGAKKKYFEKGEFIFLNGGETNSIGIILSGRAQIIKEDIFGNRAILNDLGTKAVFGESFVCGGSYPLTVSVQATENSDILLLPFDRIMHICPSACGSHNTLIKNMVEIISRKNIKLMETLEVITKRSLREKMLTYLSQLAQEQSSATVISPLGRVDLANFLGADRSALTRELGRMRDDGLIQFNKNTYTLKDVR
ncbi:Crp/Fnr family transcriptional regulator, partial [Ruminococcaceae bacterium OttesenSCG-928-A16]|nr:Crp/Fnr family transcriptional regulator [Ruminococcaceae bacterium OttesenSCG-928-A16]